jgi:hypothetical protein
LEVLGRPPCAKRVGDAITLADICLASQAAGAKFFSVDTAPFSNFTRIANSLSTIDAFARRAPAETVGCAGELI